MARILIASDIHGDLDSARAVIAAFEREKCDRLVLLGDILYHGPRNDLPTTYAPKSVIELLNAHKDVILAVRGNCDTEVDQMVLSFPILADYAFISIDGLSIFATHGHKFNLDNLPSLREGEILLHGHTHILCAEEFGNKNTYLNPGSAAIPKGGNPRTYMVYDNQKFSIIDLDGNVVLSKIL